MKKFLLGAAILVSTASSAQDTAGITNPLKFSGHIESYYTYDFNEPADNNRPGFIYSHNRHNEFNLNLGYVKASYSKDKVRGNFALAAGTYMNANYAAEPGVLKHIYEANVGYKLSGNKNLWFDIGIMPSHIGFESAHSPSCWALTRSLGADNSPYYQGGAKLTYSTDDEKWLLSGLALNGWQRIKRVEGNSLMSFGTQLTYKPTNKVTLNYSTFIGTDKADSIRQMRYYHNIYGIFQVNDLFGITAGFDVGMEEESNSNSGFNTWYTPILIAKYNVSSKVSLTARGEYYQDENGVIISTGTPNGFKTTGISLNVDYAPSSDILLRIEGRSLKSKDKVFAKGNAMNNNNSFITAAFALSF
jgi:opacity protein-like surface antigen